MTREETCDFIIRGKKNLDNDSYKRIVVEKNKVNYEINVTKNNDANSSNHFISKISNLSHMDKIEKIVKYYLYNNDITRVENYKKIKCDSSIGRVLCFRTSCTYFDDFFIKKIYEIIINKYNLDRELFLEENNDIEDYYIGIKSNISSYGIEDKSINLGLSSSNNELDEHEYYFLYEFLSNLIENSNDVKIQTYRWTEFKMAIPCFEIYIDNVKINFKNYNEEIKQMVYNVVEEYKKKTLIRRNEV